MSRLVALAAELRALLSDWRRVETATQAANQFFDEPEDVEEIGGRIRRGAERSLGLRGYSRASRSSEWEYLKNGLRLVNSSNVYGYAYDATSARMGVLYVQFLDFLPRSLGGSGERSGPGPVYGYFHFPLSKYQLFESMAAVSAGGAVWDFCRERGTMHGHQHPYQLIQVSGEYVPRKATKWGLRGVDPETGKTGRTPAAIGIGRRNHKGEQARLMLPSRAWEDRKASPARNRPNRGEPDRGEPNRG